MFLRLIVKPNPGACAYVVAWGNETMTWQFLHANHNGQSLWPRSRSRLVNYDDDYYINFKSDVPLETWLKRVKTSEFNDATQFHWFKHNCAFAATYALEAAGIHLSEKHKKIMFHRVGFSSLLRLNY